jgi:flagellar protein FlaG
MEIGSITGSAARAPANTQRAAEDGSPVTSSATADVKAAPVQTANAVQQASPAPSMDQVKQAVQDINRSLQSLSQGLEFSVDTDTKDVIVKVIDQQTKEVLRQMPSKEALEIAKALDQVLGKLIKEQA